MTEQEPGSEQDPKQGEGQAEDPEELARNKKLAAENSKWRNQVRDLEAKVDELQGIIDESKDKADQDLSDIEKLTKQVQALSDSLDNEKAARLAAESTTQFHRIASQMNIDPAHSDLLMAGVQSGLYDLEDADALQEAWKPYQKASLPNGGQPSNAPRKSAPAGLTLEDVDSMSHDEIIKRKDEIGKLLAQQAKPKPDKQGL